MKCIIQWNCCCFFKNGPTSASFSVFSVFSNKRYNFYKKLMWKMSKCPSSIRHQDSNPQPFEHESSPITTRQDSRSKLLMLGSITWDLGSFLAHLVPLVTPYILMNPFPSCFRYNSVRFLNPVVAYFGTEKL